MTLTTAQSDALRRWVMQTEPRTQPIELTLDPATCCAQCGVRLNCFPDDPYGIEWEGRRYHRDGCLGVARHYAALPTEEMLAV
jgi:hypothetical protein